MFELPMAFFDAQPPGRLIARFSKDTANADLVLPNLYLSLFEYVVGTAVAAAVVTGVRYPDVPPDPPLPKSTHGVTSCIHGTPLRTCFPLSLRALCDRLGTENLSEAHS